MPCLRAIVKRQIIATQDEPPEVYDHLAWLMSGNVLPFPVHVATKGRLSDALKSGDDHARIPAYVGAGGLSKRQCTSNFKLAVIKRKIREILGKGRRGFIAAGAVESWIGISTDEAIRQTPSGCRYITNRHPLIERYMSRQDCKIWLREHCYPEPPKSACKYCPFQGNIRWQQRRDNPEEWAEVVALDRWFRDEQFAPIKDLIETNTSGTFACPHCAATASFNRDGADWIAKCPTCDWGVAGFIGSKISVN